MAWIVKLNFERRALAVRKKITIILIFLIIATLGVMSTLPSRNPTAENSGPVPIQGCEIYLEKADWLIEKKGFLNPEGVSPYYFASPTLVLLIRYQICKGETK